MAGSNGVSPLFSIITVCRNAEALVGSTVLSVANQNFPNLEYLVVDGASTDKTVDVVRQHAGALALRVVSEPDEGIYDAMNKGVRLARGKWVYFLNAGDDFADNDVLNRVSSHLASAADNSDVAHGDVVYRGAAGHRLVRFDWVTRHNLVFEHLCHQAVFARRTAFDQIGPFNTAYRINADYDWLLRVFRQGVPSIYLGFPIAFYDDQGISAREQGAMQVERLLVRNSYLPKGLARPLQLGYRACRKLLRAAGLSTR